jgi:hypothetical protein
MNDPCVQLYLSPSTNYDYVTFGLKEADRDISLTDLNHTRCSFRLRQVPLPVCARLSPTSPDQSFPEQSFQGQDLPREIVQ